MVVGVVALFAAWGQLPLWLTQAHDRSTVAELVTQTSVLPNPLTSTLTLNGVAPHEKSLTLKPARASPNPKAVNASTAAAATAARLARSRGMASPPWTFPMADEQPSVKFYAYFIYFMLLDKS